jgi:hypothetical protein
MATIFTWSIDQMSTIQEPQPNYVVEVCWTIMGDDGNYVASVSSRHVLPNTESTFVPYEELTEETVFNWIQNALGVDGVNSAKAQVQGYIDKQINPPTVVPSVTPLPWVQE